MEQKYKEVNFGMVRPQRGAWSGNSNCFLMSEPSLLTFTINGQIFETSFNLKGRKNRRRAFAPFFASQWVIQTKDKIGLYGFNFIYRQSAN